MMIVICSWLKNYKNRLDFIKHSKYFIKRGGVSLKRVYQSENQSLLFIVILGSLTAFGPLAIDMFLPGLPNISHDFDISASTTQLTISFFMIGLALGNFLAGPIFDITGRKKPLIFSLIIFTIASLGIIFVTNIWIMIILRFIQGLTGGAGAVISRAIASDMYSGNALTKFLSFIQSVVKQVYLSIGYVMDASNLLKSSLKFF